MNACVKGTVSKAQTFGLLILAGTFPALIHLYKVHMLAQPLGGSFYIAAREADCSRVAPDIP